MQINKDHFAELSAMHDGEDNEDLSLSKQRARFKTKIGRDPTLDDAGIIAASCAEDDGEDTDKLVDAILKIEQEGYQLVEPTAATAE